MSEVNAISLSQLVQYVQQALELNFDEPIWVEAELSSVKLSRGHIYIELVEQTHNQIMAKQRGTIWRSQVETLRDTYDDLFDDIMTDGQQVRLLVNVTFHAVFGFSLNVLNIDPTYTMGLFAQQKQITIEKLIKEGIHEKNKALETPVVIQNIAVLTSRTAAGYADFIDQLAQSDPALGLQIDLYSCSMQGQSVSTDIASAIAEIKLSGREYDVICILRGGGSKLDLAAFDEEDVARQILNAPYPVWSGIGHEIDFSIVDFCAHSHFKTPTALAAAIVSYDHDFVHLLETIEDEISRQNKETISSEFQNLETISQNIQFSVLQKSSTARNYLQQRALSLGYEINHKLNQEKSRIKELEVLAYANDINHVLNRGFTLVEQGNKIIKDEASFHPDKTFNILWRNSKKEINK